MFFVFFLFLLDFATSDGLGRYRIFLFLVWVWKNSAKKWSSTGCLNNKIGLNRCNEKKVQIFLKVNLRRKRDSTPIRRILLEICHCNYFVKKHVSYSAMEKVCLTKKKLVRNKNKGAFLFLCATYQNRALHKIPMMYLTFVPLFSLFFFNIRERVLYKEP